MDQPPGEGEQSEGRGDQAAMGAGARPHAVVRPSLGHCTGSVTFDLALVGHSPLLGELHSGEEMGSMSSRHAKSCGGVNTEAVRTPEARAWGRLSSAPTVSGGEGLQARQGFASWCPSACPQPAGLSTRSPAVRPVTVSAPPAEGGTVVGRLHAQGRVGGAGLLGGRVSEHSRSHVHAGATRGQFAGKLQAGRSPWDAGPLSHPHEKMSNASLRTA